MSPVQQTGKPDFEIQEISWADYETSKNRLRYKSDLMFLDKVFDKKD